MTKPIIPQNTKYNKGAGYAKLTPEQRDFLAEFAHLVQKWNVPTIARLFGVTKQNTQYLINKKYEKKGE